MTDDQTTFAASPVQAPRRSMLRWAIALGVAAAAVVITVAAVVLLGSPSSPEALKYIPADAVLVAELRMDLPGDQMEALGKLLAHFPGFQDQTTLQEKLDEAFKKAIEKAPDSPVNYETQIKPFLSGPSFLAVTSLEKISTASQPTDVLLVATTNGAIACDALMPEVKLTHEPYGSLDLSVASEKSFACAVDGRFFIAGDIAQVKRAIDTHAAGTGMNTSPRYKAAREGLGKDRLATLYIDGAAMKAALPAMPGASANPAMALGDVAAAMPEWIMAGIRAEKDALLFDVVLAPPAGGATPDPSLRPFPAAHPSILAPLAPADSLVFYEAQGLATTIHNLVTPLKADPQFAAALAQLDQFGGVDGLIDWVDDVGVVVVRDGDKPAGALMLVAHDAASAAEKATTLKTVLKLGSTQLDADVTETTVGDVKVMNIHIPDAGAILGAGGQVLGGSVPPVALDFSIAARDRILYIGIGEGTMAKLLAVAAGTSLADDPAFKRALSHGVANPQGVFYVAAGASIDWLETIVPAEELAKYTSDVKPYVDPLESIVLTSAGDGRSGSVRLAFIVATTP